MNDVDKLIEEHRGVIPAVARKKFRSLCHDEDLLQCGMIGLWRAAEAWDGKRPFLPFACACVANAMRDYIRSQARHRKADPLEVWDAPTEPDQSADLFSLFPAGCIEHRVMFLLSSGESKAAIARRLGLSPKTVTRLCNKIRAEIEKQG